MRTGGLGGLPIAYCGLLIGGGYNDCRAGGVWHIRLYGRLELRIDKSIENGLELFYWRDGGGRDSVEDEGFVVSLVENGLTFYFIADGFGFGFSSEVTPDPRSFLRLCPSPS